MLCSTLLFSVKKGGIMSYCKRKNRYTLASKVLYRMHMIRSWRNYRFYFSSPDNYRGSFRSVFWDDYSSFCILGVSLRSYLTVSKEEKLVMNVFGEKEDFSFRRKCLERIKKLKKHGKAKLLVGHLFDDEKVNRFYRDWRY